MLSASGWLYLQHKASQKPIKTPFPHAFRTDSRARFFLQLQHQSQVQSVGPNVGLWLDVRLNADGQIVFAPSPLLKSGKPIELATTEECANEDIPTLESLAASLKKVPVILNLIARKPGVVQALLKIWGIDKPLSLDTVALQSESEGVLKELREAEPRGFYGSSQATLIQLEVLNSLRLAGLADLRSDFLVSVIDENDRNQNGQLVKVARVRESTLNEAHRRGLKRYVGPVYSYDEGQRLLGFKYDGLIIRDMTVLEQLLSIPSR